MTISLTITHPGATLQLTLPTQEKAIRRAQNYVKRTFKIDLSDPTIKIETTANSMTITISEDLL